MSSGRKRVTRRSFLQLSGAGAGTLAMSNFLAACGKALGVDDQEVQIDISNLRVGEWIEVRRPDDLLVVDFGLVNLVRTTVNGVVHLVKRRAARPALIVARFPPQHLAEAYSQSEPTSVIQHMMAGRSRLVFNVGAAPRIPLSIVGLLEACAAAGLNVAAGAAAPAGAPPVGGTTSGTTGRRELASLETSLEMPFRLMMSPNDSTQFKHAARPVTGPRGRVELWNTRLQAGRDYRTLRALDTVPGPDPFPMVPNATHRENIVDASSNWANPGISVGRLALSSQGAWFDASFDDVANVVPIFGHWDQRVAMGRDMEVRVVAEGNLWPLCHPAPLIEVSQRRMTQGPNPTAYLHYSYRVVCTHPLFEYDDIPLLDPVFPRLWPFSSVRVLTLSTPELDGGAPNTSAPLMPTVGGEPFVWQVEAVDRRGEVVRFATPLYWLPEGAIEPPATSLPGGSTKLHGQRVAIATVDGATLDARKTDTRTTFEVRTLTLGSWMCDQNTPRFYPQVTNAELVVDALAAAAGTTQPVSVSFAQTYVSHGFVRDPDKNPYEHFLAIAGGSIRADFIKGGTDKVGGFIAPNLDFDGLSRLVGPLPKALTVFPLPQTPPKLSEAVFPLPLGNAIDAFCPRLFGCISLVQLVQDGLGVKVEDLVPKFVTEAFDDIQRLVQLKDLLFEKAGALHQQMQDALARIPALLAELREHATWLENAFRTGAQDLVRRFKAAVESLFDWLKALDPDRVTDAEIRARVQAIRTNIDDVKALAVRLASDKTVKVLEYIPGALEEASSLLRTIRRALSVVVDVSEGANDVLGVVETAAVALVRARDIAKDKSVKIDWKPPIKSPLSLPGVELTFGRTNPLLLSVEMRAKQRGNAKAGADVLCSLEDFNLEVLSLIRLEFKRLQFRQRMSQKPEIDVVFNRIKFIGPLEFVETLKEVLPLDGFSDPPHVKVDAKGLDAGFSLALPNVAVGMFTLENLRIGANLLVPFLGDSIVFKFYFGRREDPCLVTVSMLGGGGYFEIECTPDGPRAIVASVQFGAQLSIDLVVASGSVQVMGGFTFRLDPSGVSLKGFLRIRGECDILGLISAAIELYLELEYKNEKLIGTATLEIEISLAFFTLPVTITTSRKFAGANGDPPFQRQVSLPAYRAYCNAFA